MKQENKQHKPRTTNINISKCVLSNRDSPIYLTGTILFVWMKRQLIKNKYGVQQGSVLGPFSFSLYRFPMRDIVISIHGYNNVKQFYISSQPSKLLISG